MWTGKRKQRIALASDPAFPFLYRQSIDKTKGDITRFSPVYGSELPEADIVHLPGGYPELFARQLHRRKRLMEQLREYVEKGGKLLAEGGGNGLARTDADRASRRYSLRNGGNSALFGHCER